VTLTLAGIAGFILSVGMAIDANILIFERMKEELRSGKELNLSIIDGFKRSWNSIRDSNISSIITCLILYFATGSGPIRGFALTLLLGIIVSLFTAITVTRTILLLLSTSPLKRFIHV
jgi:preprotein translocase subunit SecD